MDIFLDYLHTLGETSPHSKGEIVDKNAIHGSFWDIYTP